MRPRMKGPRSLMRTITLRPFRRLVTRTFVPNLKLLWAAVMAFGFMRSPDAVLFPGRLYQDAPPHCFAAWPWLTGKAKLAPITRHANTIILNITKASVFFQHCLKAHDGDIKRKLKNQTNKMLHIMTDLQNWIGKSETATALIDERQAELMAATFDQPIPTIGDTLPPCWHWAWFNHARPHSELGRDGHPKRGENSILPPITLPRRMWAGGKIEFLQPLKVGTKITKKSTIEKIAEKNGSTGKLCIVTVLHELFDGGTLCIREKQNLVFREDPQPDAPKASPPEAPKDASVSRTITPDPVTMFRYSALTFNGHRIHYDIDYARDIEGYDGLVFHAPLTATLLISLAAEIKGKPVSSFEYRATSPLFGHEAFTIHAKQDANAITVWAQTPSGGQAMIGEAS